MDKSSVADFGLNSQETLGIPTRNETQNVATLSLHPEPPFKGVLQSKLKDEVVTVTKGVDAMQDNSANVGLT